MTLEEAKAAWKSPFAPVKYDGIIYTRIKQLIYDCDGSVYLNLYNADTNYLCTALPENVHAVSTEEYFAYRAQKKGQAS